MTIEIHSHCPDDTFAIGEKIGRRLKGNEIIFLVGELGAGKTLLTKGVARSLGIDPAEVVSPTFTLINEFRGKDNYRLFHVDLYRLGPGLKGNLPEIDDYIDEGIIVIEWAQYLDPVYFKSGRSVAIAFQLVKEDENARVLEIDTRLESLTPETFRQI